MCASRVTMSRVILFVNVLLRCFRTLVLHARNLCVYMTASAMVSSTKNAARKSCCTRL